MNPRKVNDSINLSVLFCTRNRAQSLKETIEYVLAADRTGLVVELVIIDNDSSDETPQVAAAFADRIPVRYYLEKKIGKGHSLNRALDEGGLGRVTVGLDDDMIVDSGWIKAVIAACDRNPDVDLFSGHVYMVWPPGPIPWWAKNCRTDIRGWGLSIMGEAADSVPDRLLRPDRWGCGNHFWFRSKLIADHSRFGSQWVPEPGLFFDHMSRGSKGMFCNNVRAGHRIQPQLLEEETMCKRAVVIGRSFATSYACPYRSTVKIAWHFKHRPIRTRIGAVGMLAYYAGLYTLARVCGSKDRWFERRIHAIERFTLFWELLRLVSRDQAYRVWPWGARD
jgi:glycosyltransferase involved in cell wall biosynthesis